MKLYLLLGSLLVIFSRTGAQEPNQGKSKDSLDKLTGVYQMNIDTAQQFKITRNKNQLMLEVIGQGQTTLTPLGGNKYTPDQVSPPATITFITDSQGYARKFTWDQERKDNVSEFFPVASSGGGMSPGGYAGRYKAKGNPNTILHIDEKNGFLEVRINEGSRLLFSPASKDKFALQRGDFSASYEFVRDKKGNIQKLLTSEDGPVEFIRTTETAEAALPATHIFGSRTGYTRADSLQGMLTPLRTCYDVLFYGLDIRVMPETKSIKGNTTIRFRAIQSFTTMQVDLFANMKIEKVLFNNHELSYTRECNAVFIQFPATINMGKEEAITIYYSGKPQIPDIATLKGGFLWFHDKEGNSWIESVCQGSGASLWWPCKDHLSDKPDSMSISISVPNGLNEISNGRLLKKTALTDGYTRYDWYVSYPINNYDVAVNIGNYSHFSDYFISGHDSMALNYYCMPYNKDKAAKIFQLVKPMLSLYEKDFGVYPFQRDGFTLMESLYPMEHQGAVSMGPISNPVNSDSWDEADTRRTAFHESAHEWWGNNVTCSDMADLWIHEAFATYSEVLAYEKILSKDAAIKYLKEQTPGNEESIIGIYNVNDFHLGDMYPKGCLMLHTLRNIIDNDSLWFGILRGIQEHFRYQSVRTEDIVGYFNQAIKKNFTAFFDQYLRHTAIPELDLAISNEGTTLQVKYKWKADVSGFDMPVKVTTSKNSFTFIYPTSDWQSLHLQNMSAEDFKVDLSDFYISVKKE